MSPNVNPYYDQGPVHSRLPVVQANPGDSGMPGWMPVSALFFGLALFAVVLFGAASRSGSEIEPTQGAQQAATQPAKTNAAQPAATQAKAQSTAQQQNAQQGQQQQQQRAAPAQPPNPTATTGSAPAR
ncbi:MAG: hypothetical protein ACR2K5_02185 [Pseudolabrys sp.]